MRQSDRKKCENIIHTSSIAAGVIGAGLAQVPVADSVALLPVQTGMIMQLAKVFHKNMDAEGAVAILGQQVVQAAGKQLAKEAGKQLAKEVLKKIPVAGNIANASIAASLTEGLGWAVATMFANG